MQRTNAWIWGSGGGRNWEIGIDVHTILILGFPGGSEVRIHLQCRRCRFDPWVRKIACLGNSMDKETWWATVHGVIKD